VPIDRLDRLAMLLTIGDSIADGYNARGRNGRDGHAFGRLLANDLGVRHPMLDFRVVAESGATTGDALDNLRNALSGSLPREVDGDVLVVINAGGNDVNDDVRALLTPATTAALASSIRANLAEMIRLVRARYEDPARGRDVVVLVDNIHDPTDGTGMIPSSFDDGFCGVLGNPLLGAFATTALANLAVINDAIAMEAGAQSALLVDLHAVFLGHGMNGGADRWIDSDCAHPTDAGHAAIRDAAFRVLETPR
jgi:lysophospholipase L1-like esterase